MLSIHAVRGLPRPTKLGMVIEKSTPFLHLNFFHIQHTVLTLGGVKNFWGKCNSGIHRVNPLNLNG